MAPNKRKKSSKSTNSDPSRGASSSSSIRRRPLFQDLNVEQPTTCDGYDDGCSYNTMTVEGLFNEDPPSTESTLLDVPLNLMDAPLVLAPFDLNDCVVEMGKSDEEVWREIVAAEEKEMKEETREGTMTLEAFLAKTGVEDAAKVAQKPQDTVLKNPSCGVEGGMYGLDHSAASQNPFHMIDRVEGSIVSVGNGSNVYGGGGRGGGVRGKRGRMMILEPLDKAAAKKQRRMIKNRESAARSRERKQAYNMELEALAAQLELENEILTRDFKKMEKDRILKQLESPIRWVKKPVLRRTKTI